MVSSTIETIIPVRIVNLLLTVEDPYHGEYSPYINHSHPVLMNFRLRMAYSHISRPGSYRQITLCFIGLHILCLQSFLSGFFWSFFFNIINST